MATSIEDVKSVVKLREYAEEHLERMGRTFVCPNCKSGKGPNKTPAFSIKGERWHCFACEAGGDVLDLVGYIHHTKDQAEQLHILAEEYNLESDCDEHYDFNDRVKTQDEPEPKRPEDDFTEGRERERQYIQAMRANIENEYVVKYLERRGITVEDARKLGFGYDPQRGRLIIPWKGTDYYHIDRDIMGNQAHKYEKPKSDTVGPQPLYNPSSLDKDAFIVVEGALDAAAVWLCGRSEVVALGGTGTNQLVSALKKKHYQGGVILMLDNDQAGKDATKRLKEQLDELKIPCLTCFYDWVGDRPYKDAGDILAAQVNSNEVNVRYRFGKVLTSWFAQAVSSAASADKMPNMTLHDPAEVASRIYFEEDADTPIPTGIKSLDRIIGGGLMRGLYVIGATSSFGKTTISVEIGDNIASAGHPVLFVTIEQSAQEIVAKSLSRLSHDEHNSHTGGLSAQEITTSSARKTWNTDKWQLLISTTNAYTTHIAPNLRILEGIKRPSVQDIRVAADKMTADYGQSPVIIIDYLQLLSPRNERDTDKMSVDYNVTALRQFARDLKTPVWCVATLNRESYSGPVDLDSFKESGAVEYGCDYAFGLQPSGIAAEVEGVKSAVEKKLKGNAFISRAKRENPRKVELTVLKNRQGETTGNANGITLTYWPRTNLFIEG